MSSVDTTLGRILVVDDQPANLRVVDALLSREGYTVTTAASGPDALARYAEAVPDAWLQLEIGEGRNRQVRRMTAAVGLPTLRLVRVAIGGHRLDGLLPGQWRFT